MKLQTTRLAVFAAAFLFAVVMAMPSWAQTAEEIAKIEQAMPAEARVEPGAPRKVLVFNLCHGFKHGAIPYGAKTFEIMAEKTGAFSVVQSDDIAMFEPENLKQFDAVIMNNTTGNLFIPANVKELSEDEKKALMAYRTRLQNSLLDFVKSGKGIVGIHAATDCFYAWPEYGEMMGGYFAGHPWNEEVTVKLDDPAHPVNAAFNGCWFRVADEIYQFRAPYSRENLRVLLSLDTERTDMKKKLGRDDGDFAVSWVRSYGDGRVFYCSLGHRPEIFWNPAVLQHYLDGIQFALGDLEADTTPSAALETAYLEESTAQMRGTRLDTALEQVAALDFGMSPPGRAILEDEVREASGDEEAIADLEKRLDALLLAPDATVAGKQFACRQVAIIGSEDSVPALASLLTDPVLNDMVRYALDRIPGDEAAQALRTALPGVDGLLKIGIIHSLGARADAQAVPALADLLQSGDQSVADAAAEALGEIATGKAAKALAQATAADSRFANALLTCARCMDARGNTRRAAAIYNGLYEAGMPDHIHAAAFVGRVDTAGNQAARVVAEGLKSESPQTCAAALGFVRDLSDDDATTRFADVLPSLSPERQAMLVRALGDRGDSAALAAVTVLADSDNEDLRLATYRAIGQLGGKESVPLLVETAAEAKGTEQQVLRYSLATLSSPGVNAALIPYLQADEPAVREQVASVLPERSATEAIKPLFFAAKDPEKKVRREAIRALAQLCSQDDIPALVQLLTDSYNEADVKEATRAIVAITKRTPGESGQAVPLLEALGRASSLAMATTLIEAIGQVGDDSALASLDKFVSHEYPEIQEVTVRALSEWPSAAPMHTLFDVATDESRSETQRILALRGALRMMLLTDEEGERPLSQEEMYALYVKAMDMALRPEEKRMVITGMGDIRTDAAREFVEKYSDDPELTEEVKLARAKLSRKPYRAIASLNPEEAAFAIDGNPDTRWSTKEKQQSGQYFRVDLGKEHVLKQIILDSAQSPDAYPREYTVFASPEGSDWAPAASGKGTGPVTTINLNNVRARFVAILQTGSTDGAVWAIHEFKVAE